MTKGLTILITAVLCLTAVQGASDVELDASAPTWVPAADSRLTWGSFRALRGGRSVGARISEAGLSLVPVGEPDSLLGEAWQWGLAPVRWGQESLGRELRSVETVWLDSPLDRVLLSHRDGTAEMYENNARGWRQIIVVPDVGTSGQRRFDDCAPLRLDLAVKGDLAGTLHGDGRAASFRTPDGSEAVRYTALRAEDGVGNFLPLHLELGDNPHSIALIVEAESAVPPITIESSIALSGGAEGTDSARAVGHLVISEIQVRGNNGSNDEFVEIYNPTDSAVSL